MHSVTEPDQTTIYAPEDDDAYAEAWHDNAQEEDTMPYGETSRRWQVVRLFLLLLLIVAAAAFVVFVLLPTLDSWLTPGPMPQLQPPVQV